MYAIILVTTCTYSKEGGLHWDTHWFIVNKGHQHTCACHGILCLVTCTKSDEGLCEGYHGDTEKTFIGRNANYSRLKELRSLNLHKYWRWFDDSLHYTGTIWVNWCVDTMLFTILVVETSLLCMLSLTTDHKLHIGMCGMLCTCLKLVPAALSG